MIKFKKIQYANFFSIGNNPIIINLDESIGTLIIGTNGVGKSTFVSAICYALYGKPYKDVLQGSIVNAINKKQLLVEIWFEIGSEKYHIRRGMKPSVFEIYLNDVLLNIDGIGGDYQSYLEKNILKMSFHTFKQIVVIGNSGFTPFLKLPAGKRREMIENILDLIIFSVMNTLTKNEISALNSTKELLERSQFELNVKIKSEKEKIEFLSKKQDDDIEERRRLIQDSIETKTTQLNKIPTEFPDLDEQLKKLNDNLKVIDRKEAVTSTELSYLSKEHDILNHDNCPTCKQVISEDFKNTKKLTIDESINEKNELLTKLKKVRTNIKNQVTEINIKIDKRNQLVKIAEKLKFEINQLKVELSNVKEKVELDTKNMAFLIEEYNNDLEEVKEKITQTQKDVDLRKLSLTVLKDDGVKSKIIKTYIPLINSFINHYLEEMNFYISFEIDENFNETIKSRHRDIFTYENFSDGEKARIDLAFLFAWRKISKLRNGITTNLLILDEVFSGSLDSSGIDDLNMILRNLEDSNVFVITHRVEGTIEKFDSVIEFQKINNFTQISRNGNDVRSN